MDRPSISMHWRLDTPMVGTSTSVRAPAPGPSSIARNGLCCISISKSFPLLSSDLRDRVSVASATNARTILATVFPSRKKF